jgi:hypothetical protein
VNQTFEMRSTDLVFTPLSPLRLKEVAVSDQSQQALNPYSLSGITLSRFREAFGAPNLTMGHDYQWSLKTSPFGTDINVLVNGTQEKPVVWIFDPNDRADGVSRSAIEDEESILVIIDHIRDRVLKASKISHKPRKSKDDV